MPAKKKTPSTVEASADKPVAKKTPKPAAKKAAKPAVKKAGAKSVAAKSAAKVSVDEVARAAYLNYRRRVEQGLPGDSHGDWLEAERRLSDLGNS